jgi:glucokinase
VTSGLSGAAPIDTALAVDIGSTKMAAGLVDRQGRLLSRAETPTDGSLGAEGLFSALLAVIERARHGGGSESAPATAGHRLPLAVAGGDGGAPGEHPMQPHRPALPAPSRCGVGTAGPIEPGGETVSPLNTAAWRRFPLRRRLIEATGLPTYVDLDAKALARGEGWIGAAAGVGDFVALVVSTGGGGGIVSGGRLLHGAAANAGHIGHVIVEPDGAVCACGARGCLEAEASGPAIARRTGRPPREADAATIAPTGRLGGRAVASVANQLDLSLAVVAGSVALGFGAPFFAAAQDELDRSCQLEFSRGCRIVPAGLGDRGPLVGAAAVAFAAT